MPRGKKHGTNSNAVTAAATTYFLAYLRERVQHEIDRFTSTVPVSAVELSAGLVELLSDAGERADHQMPLRLQAGSRRTRSSALESGEQSHGRRSSHQADQRTGEGAVHTIKKRKKGFFANLSKKQMAAVMRDRLMVTASKRSLTQAEKARLKTLKERAGDTVAPKTPKATAPKKRTGRRSLSEQQHKEKQKIYIQRSQLRAQGVPEDQLPPLPKRIAA